MELPKKVEECLSVCGGIDGLDKKIQSDELLNSQAEVYKALSDSVRLKVLSALSQGTMCVCVLKEIIEIPDSRLSYHLNVLKDTGLITSIRDGNYVLYELTNKGENIIKSSMLEPTWE